MVRLFTRGCFCVTVLLMAALILTGCSSGKKTADPAGAGDGKEAVQLQEGQTEEQTEFFTEAELATEEELVYYPVTMILDEQTRQWAEQFDEKKADRLIYTSMGEETQEFVIEDPVRIRTWFDALMSLTVAGKVDEYTADTGGDTFTFYMEDEQAVTFSMIMGSLVLDGFKYETAGGEALWDLTGELLTIE